MTRALSSLTEVASEFDAIVLDQWGVLHDGAQPYAGAVDALERLVADGHRLAVLSNSGKRAGPNASRISEVGFPPALFESVMTSGEALWRDIAEDGLPERLYFPIERAPGDARAWAEGLDVTMVNAVSGAEAVLLMGLPDGAEPDMYRAELDAALDRGLPVYCSNPDKASPRHGGGLVISPGLLAAEYAARGGTVRFYGKPHLPIFHAVSRALNAHKLLMVGDSLEHDIAGAHSAGWASLLIQGGLYAERFAAGSAERMLETLCTETGVAPPTFRMETLA